MRKWVAAALPALPVFILGGVLVLVVLQIRLANLQAATSGFGVPAASNRPITAAALQDQQQGQQQPSPPVPVERDTLVIYIYNEDDPIFKENFHYFLLAGVQADSR